MSIEAKRLLNVWTPVSHLLFVPQTENKYNRIVSFLDVPVNLKKSKKNENTKT